MSHEARGNLRRCAPSPRPELVLTTRGASDVFDYGASVVKDLVLVTCVVVAFATLVTSHLAIVFGLTIRPPRWRGVVALVAPPLGPYWSWREGMRVRTLFWLGALALYAMARVAASF